MTDARVPDRWLTDRRIQSLDAEPYRAFFQALMWSVANRTDGVIGAADLDLIPHCEAEHAAVFVASDLWEHVEGGWRFLDHALQTSAAQLRSAEQARAAAQTPPENRAERRREKDRDRARRYRERQRDGSVTDSVITAGQTVRSESERDERDGSVITAGHDSNSTDSPTENPSASRSASRSRHAKQRDEVRDGSVTDSVITAGQTVRHATRTGIGFEVNATNNVTSVNGRTATLAPPKPAHSTTGEPKACGWCRGDGAPGGCVDCGAKAKPCDECRGYGAIGGCSECGNRGGS